MSRIACRVTKASLLVAVAFALNAPAIGQDADAKLYDLHLSTPKGTTVWFVESVTREQTYTIGGKDVTVPTVVNRTFDITVKQVDAKGNRVIEIHAARIAGWTQAHPGQANKTLFDSNDPDNNDGGKTDGISTWRNRTMAWAGRRYIARIDVNGKLVGSMAAIAHEMQNEDPKTQVQAWQLAELAETAFGRTPATPTAIGGTWKFVQPGAGAMRLARHATLTLAKVTDSAFEMALNGTVEKGKMPTTPKAADPNSADAKAAEQNKASKIRNGKLTGKQTLSRQDGLIIARESKSTFDTDIPINAQILTIKMVVKTKLTRTTKPRIKPRPTPKAPARAGEDD